MWVKYNYLAINALSEKQEAASELLRLMLTESAQKTYLQKFPHYLPALLSLESDMMEQKINPDYNIVYKDFFDANAIPVSFQTGDTTLYDSLMQSVLDAGESASTLFESSKQKLICTSNKISTLTNLSSSCK
jgi:ABC-type glycerol-3-phosphate transport system substrate-binding protein